MSVSVVTQVVQEAVVEGTVGVREGLVVGAGGVEEMTELMVLLVDFLGGLEVEVGVGLVVVHVGRGFLVGKVGFGLQQSLDRVVVIVPRQRLGRVAVSLAVTGQSTRLNSYRVL